MTYYLWYEKRVGSPLKRLISEDDDLELLLSEASRLNTEKAPSVFWVESETGRNISSLEDA